MEGTACERGDHLFLFFFSEKISFGPLVYIVFIGHLDLKIKNFRLLSLYLLKIGT